MKQILFTLSILSVLFTFSCRSKKELVDNSADKLPVCLQQKTEEYKKLGKKYRPTNITRYLYKGKFVYYIPSRCCDVMSEVLDENCTLICQPEGGFTGKGDGKCPDFLTERKEGKIIWEDSAD